MEGQQLLCLRPLARGRAAREGIHVEIGTGESGLCARGSDRSSQVGSSLRRGGRGSCVMVGEEPTVPCLPRGLGGLPGQAPGAGVLVVLQQGRERPRAPNRVGSQGEILTKGRAVRLQLLESFCIS